MNRGADILDRREPLRNPFAGSLALHAGVVAALALSTWYGARPRQYWGDPNAFGGGAVGITPVKSLPVPYSDGPRNPVASDTTSQAPRPLKPETKARKSQREDPDAIALKSKRTRSRTEPPLAPNPRLKQPEPAPNQLTSRVGQAASSQMFGMTTSAGQLGVGTGAPFGTRFGAYAILVQDRVAQRWRTDEVDPRLRTAPPAVVTFDVLRSGEVRNVRVVQSSGILALDNSAQRAIMSAAPFPPLPAAYDGAAASIEFWFTLKR